MSYGFVRVLERFKTVDFCVYVNVVTPYDTIFVVKDDLTFVFASWSYQNALEFYEEYKRKISSI